MADDRGAAGADAAGALQRPATRCWTVAPWWARRRAGGSAGPRSTCWPRPAWRTATESADELRTAAADAGLDASVWNADAPSGEKFKALVFDASGHHRPARQLAELHRFFHSGDPHASARTGAWSCWARRPRTPRSPGEHTAQRALEGFTRSLGKEMRGGGTVQLVYVAPGRRAASWTARCASCCRRSRPTSRARWCGSAQAERAAGDSTGTSRCAGKVALVTGASRGIGASIASVLARDGAHVVGLDIPALGDDLRTVTSELGGSALEVDVTDADAPKLIADHLEAEHGGVDVVVHNAGVTRDKTIAGHGRGPLAPGDRHQPVEPGADRQPAAGGRDAQRRRADRDRVLDERHRRQQRPDQLRHLQGGRDRHGRLDGAGVREARAPPSTRSRPGSSRPR